MPAVVCGGLSIRSDIEDNYESLAISNRYIVVPGIAQKWHLRKNLGSLPVLCVCFVYMEFRRTALDISLNTVHSSAFYTLEHSVTWSVDGYYLQIEQKQIENNWVLVPPKRRTSCGSSVQNIWVSDRAAVRILASYKCRKNMRAICKPFCKSIERRPV